MRYFEILLTVVRNGTTVFEPTERMLGGEVYSVLTERMLGGDVYSVLTERMLGGDVYSVLTERMLGGEVYSLDLANVVPPVTPTDELLPAEMQNPSDERVEPDGQGDVLPLP